MIEFKTLSSQQLKALLALRYDRLAELYSEQDEIDNELLLILKELESRSITPV